MTRRLHDLSGPAPGLYKHLNFKVPPEFHREFKIYAASHNISMTALLIEAFKTYVEQKYSNACIKDNPD